MLSQARSTHVLRPARGSATGGIRRSILGMAVALMAGGCVAPSTLDLASPSIQTQASAVCTPANARLEARFGWDAVQNFSGQTVYPESVELDARASGLELVKSGFIRWIESSTVGGVGAYDGTFDGESTLRLLPGETAVVDVVLRSTGIIDIATTPGLVVHGRRADGTAVSAHTCWTLAVAPPSVDCGSGPEGHMPFDPATEYLNGVCSTN